MRILRSKKAKIWLVATLSVILALVAACFIYLGIYYPADEEAVAAFAKANEEYVFDGNLVFKPENVNYGLIFYPGGKVDERAYIPLMREISSHGVLCVLVKMPWRLAVFDVNAADGIIESFPEIDVWYIGGHSLGGSMAAAYLEENHEDFRGLFLLGSYSASDISKTRLRTLSIYGSLDGVMHREKYASSLANVPEDFKEIVIEGGNHAYFGTYGKQSGDGEAKITNPEQIKITSDAIISWIKS